MILNIEKINNNITERLTLQETTEQTAFALDRVTKILNNDFISQMFETSKELTFSSVEEVDGDITSKHLKVNIASDKIVKGMVISIHNTLILDGYYIVKSNDGTSIIFENEAIIEEDFVTTASWYLMDLPIGTETVIWNVIDILRLDMGDIAGLESIQQGNDSKTFKSGSHLTHYITKTLQGYYKQPNNTLLYFKKIKEEISRL